MTEEELHYVKVTDSDGNVFVLNQWRKTANKLDVIRWTLEHGDLPYYIDINKIVKIIID